MTAATVETIRAALRVLSRHYDDNVPAGEDVALLRSCAIDQAETNLPIDELACLVVERTRKKFREEKSHLSAVAEADKLTFRSGTQIEDTVPDLSELASDRVRLVGKRVDVATTTCYLPRQEQYL